MQPHYLPATRFDDASGCQQTVMAFLAEKKMEEAVAFALSE
jgi:hypothetical protein